jgi:hypothetical protein
MRVQANILDGGPNNRQATGLGGEDVDLGSRAGAPGSRDFQWRWSSEWMPSRKLCKGEGVIFAHESGSQVI